MIKAIIFDFDGVILESADMKTEAFRKLFCDYPDYLDEIIGHHLKHQGISRYVKFRHIYKEILKKDLTRDAEEDLGKRFSDIALQEVMRAPFVTGAKEFLEEHDKRYHFFIASGTPEGELLGIISARGLEKHFKDIHGSPKTKADIIRSIKGKYAFSEKEMVYIGDADTDRVAAEEAGIAFIERDAAAPPIMGLRYGHLVIRDLKSLKCALNKVEKPF